MCVEVKSKKKKGEDEPREVRVFGVFHCSIQPDGW